MEQGLFYLLNWIKVVCVFIVIVYSMYDGKYNRIDTTLQLVSSQHLYVHVGV